jgi:exopolysaccharide biosynthesis polyprenyl glycosylphosphotransferase
VLRAANRKRIFVVPFCKWGHWYLARPPVSGWIKKRVVGVFLLGGVEGMRTVAQFCVRLFSLLDALLVSAVLAFTWRIDFQRPFPDFFFVLMIVPFWRWFYAYFGLYESHRLEGLVGLTRKVLSAHLLGLSILLLLIRVLHLPFAVGPALQFGAITTAVIILPKWAVYWLLQTLRERGHDKHNVCVIGSWEKAQELEKEFANSPAWGLHVSLVGTCPSASRSFLAYPSGHTVSGSLEEVLKREVVDEVFIAVPVEELSQEEPTVQLCREFGLESRILLSLLNESKASQLNALTPPRGIAVVGKSFAESYLWLKGAVDFLGAIFLLVLTSPLLLLVAILVKLSSPGPILFRQERVGLHGRHFIMYKFRTMINGAEDLVHTVSQRSMTKGPVFKTTEDWRITSIGRLLRRFSLDEFPQLFNVLKGEMSLVGPRPLPVSESDAIAGEHRRRFSMRPGLTCLWQVSGRSDVEYQRWMKYDLEYVDNWSLWLDAKLLFRTIPVVISGKGAY